MEAGVQIPTTGSSSYLTLEDNQTAIPFVIYMGNHPIAGNNAQIGEITLSGLSEKPAGEAGANVYFGIDAHGILSVRAEDISNPKNFIDATISKAINIEHSFEAGKGSRNLSNLIDDLDLRLQHFMEKYE